MSVVSTVAAAGHSAAAHVATLPGLAGQGYDPFDRLTPSFGPFNGLLSSKIGMFLGIAWALAFCWCAYQLIESGGKLASAKKSRNPVALQEAQSDIIMPVGATVFLAVLPLVYALLIK